jgi:phasin family protein
MVANSFEKFFNLDMQKTFADMKVPGVDVDAIVSSQKKNIEALTEANKLAYEGVQALFKRQAELVRQSVEEASSAAQEISKAGNVNERMAKQTEITKEAVEKTLANMREMSEMVVKSNSEVVDLLNSRFTQSLDEMKTMFEKEKA